MSQNDPFLPGDCRELPPPPPAYPVTSDIPPESPYHYSPTPNQGSRRGLGSYLGGLLAAVWAFVKFGGLLIFKIPAAGTLISLVISFGGYALFYGPWFAVALVTMIFVHEMGHVLEIRRQGMQATAPLFIPFLGAAIFQRSHPTDALHQAEIGIAGPIAGTLASIATLVLFGATGFKWLAFWAFIGFAINLFNMIPFGMLDGAWVLAAASKWFQVVGLLMLGVAVFFFHTVFSGLLIILLLFGIPAMIERFRNDKSPYYKSVPVEGRILMGLAWLALVAIQGFGVMQALYALGP